MYVIYMCFLSAQHIWLNASVIAMAVEFDAPPKSIYILYILKIVRNDFIFRIGCPFFFLLLLQFFAHNNNDNLHFRW